MFCFLKPCKITLFGATLKERDSYLVSIPGDFQGIWNVKIRQAIWKLVMIKKNWKWKGAVLLKLQCITPLHVRVTRKSILVKMSNIRSFHQLYACLSVYFKAYLRQLYAELTVFLYNTFTHVRKGSVNFDLTWRKWVVKLRKWGLYATITLT